MLFKKFVSAAILVGLVSIIQNVFLNEANSPITLIEHSLLKSPNRYCVNGENKKCCNCCPRLRKALSSALSSCFKCCSSSDEEEEEIEISGIFTSTDTREGAEGVVQFFYEGDVDQSTSNLMANLESLLRRYFDFGCDRNPQTEACRALASRILHKIKKLRNRGVESYSPGFRGIYTVS